MELRSQEYDRLSLSVPGPSYGNDFVHSGTRNLEAPFIEWIIKKDEIDRKIVELKKKLDDLKSEALLKIEELDNEDYKNILVLKYLQYKTWEDIASSLYICERTARRWHSIALKLLKI